MAKHKLDDPQLFKKYDPEGMLDHLHRLPQLCQQAWQMALGFELPPDYADIDKVLILGMGGSAIGGDLAASLTRAEAGLPVMVSRGYELPAFTDAKTLVIASSYSGNTEETLTSFGKALTTEAKKLAMTTGGRLKAMARERGVPVFSFDYQAQPRAALPFSLLPILCFLYRLGFISDKSPEVAGTVPLLSELASRIAETVPQAQNPAKQLASRLHNHLPVVYGAGITAEVAHRWKTQFNENSKAWAFHEVFPELNHNAVVGYQFPKELAGSLVVVMLRSALLSERIQLRYRITGKLLERARVDYQIVDGEGESPLSQMMSLVTIGDFVSYYLALLYGTDPSPVKTIDFLKQQLAQE
jgi:glucose/mannose-6-phosphate isomerase